MTSKKLTEEKKISHTLLNLFVGWYRHPNPKLDLITKIQ